MFFYPTPHFINVFNIHTLNIKRFKPNLKVHNDISIGVLYWSYTVFNICTLQTNYIHFQVYKLFK